MGDKNFELGSGTLCIGDKILVGRVTTTETKYDDKKFTNDQIYIKIPSSQEATFTARTDYRHVLRLFVPNNWLKMHGYPMRRRRKR